MAFDQKEYQSIILAALLHDIGKFLHRVTGIEELTGMHQDLGADFVSGKGVFSKAGAQVRLNSFSQMIQDDWVYKDRLEESIRKHHSGYKPWGWIVHKADSYSTKERFREGEKVTTYPPKGPLIPLKPTFGDVYLGKTKPNGIFGYDAKNLDSFNSFPEKNKSKLVDNETLILFKNFIDELLLLKNSEPTFDKFYNTLHSVLEKYLWGLPCHTHPEIADISIFDHLRSTSAIAACLYQYHSHKNTLTVSSIQVDEEKKFLLVAGDLSGIQNYIYQISAITGEGGVAKRLRARSFYISALLEVTIVKILNKLKLPVSCNLVSAGGKFIILAPNVEQTKEQLKTLYKEISDWFLEEFSGELYLIMDWNTEIAGADFYRRLDTTLSEISAEENDEAEEEDNPAEQRRCNFRDRLDEMHFAVENKKLAKFKISLHNHGIWHENKFIRTDKYEAYSKGLGDCRSCKKFPAEYQDPHDADGSEKVLCKQCAFDKVIGRKLLNAEYLAIGCDVTKERSTKANAILPKDWDSFFVFDDCYFIQPLESYQWEPDFLLLQKLRDHVHEPPPIALGMVYRFLANYTPFFKQYSENEKLCKLCKEPLPCEQIEMMKIKRNDRHLYTFSCISAASSKRTDNPKEYQGSQLIGVLKADVDNLGLIFSEGLENKLTISRYLTMSRMLDLFFSGWMYRILDATPEFHEIYTVYSGGDDLVLVGPWERLIYFALRLNEEFRRFTCNNENITLSAGMAVVSPKYPISAAVELADKYLEMSKVSGKDRFTVFDSTVKWSEIGRLLEFKDTLNKGHEAFSAILTTGFIHRLLTYQQMYLDAKKGNIKKLLFHSHMHYDVRRNLIERIIDLKDEKKLSWFNENIAPLLLKLYQTPPDKDLMNNLKIPVFWTLYKNRKYKKGG